MTDPLGEAAARLERAVAGLEARVRVVKAEAAAGEGDLFAGRANAEELEAAAREASDVLARTADELRALLAPEQD